MKITIDIPSVDKLADAINNLASAYQGQPLPTNVVKITDQPEQPTPQAEPTEELTPAQKRKAELTAEIIALGGTPPESGAVKKFETVLAELKADDQQQKPEVEEIAEEVTPESEVEKPSEELPATEPTSSDEPATLEEVRMLAGYVVKNQDDFDGKTSSLGKTKLSACLKKFGAGSITLLFEQTPEKVEEFVKLLETNAGKSLAEVVAETTAE